MKIIKTPHSKPDPDDDLAAEYAFDYTKAKPNRFAPQDSRSRITVMALDEDTEDF